MISYNSTSNMVTNVSINKLEIKHIVLNSLASILNSSLIKRTILHTFQVSWL